MGSVLSKASGLYDNLQWQSLCQNLFLVKVKAIARSGNDRARGRLYDKIFFKFMAVTEPVFSKAGGLVTEYVTDSVFNKASDLSYKYESFTINDNGGVCAGVCFW